MILTLGALTVIAPAAAQDRGLFSRLLGKTYVSAQSEDTYDVCTFQDDGTVVLTCTHNDGTQYRRRFKSDSMMETVALNATKPWPYELYSRGLTMNTGRRIEIWYFDQDGALNVMSRAPYQGQYVYSQSRFIESKSLDLRDSISKSADYHVSPNEDDNARLAPAFERILSERGLFLGKPIRVAREGRRLALVIGNARYHALSSLNNTVRDAALIAENLRKAGFTVEVLADADHRTTQAAIARLSQRVRAAGSNATALFFYTGHGLQWHGANYVIPVDAAFSTEADVHARAIPAESILAQIGLANVATSIVILDACRDVPPLPASPGLRSGLAKMNAPNGSYIAYATAPGSTATDGTGRHSPFAAALANEMLKPGQPIEAMFRNVRAQVNRETRGKQTPWDSTSLFQSFYFTPAQ